MAEITQRLGFEASQAIQSIKDMDAALGGLNRRLKTFNDRTNVQGTAAAGQSLQNLANQAKAADAALQNNAKNFRQAGEAGKRAGTTITASWQTMLRVVQTQLLVRALGQVIDLFGEAVDSAREFELQVGRISNIADGPAGSIDRLSESLRQISAELGRSLDEVGGAAFEALQNDLGSTEETLQFVRSAAADLALVTGGDLTDSVNTLSSVLKIFNIDIDDAGRVSDVLFGTIDAGRVTLDDLANSLGSVGPLAAQVGVSFEELSAAIAAITLQGVDSAKAQTQLRGVFNALLKPTDALRAAFEELGVTSGRDLIETSGGLVEALQALEQVAGDNEEQFAAFFGRIRGQLGALNVLNDGASNASRILEELATNFGRTADAAQRLNELDARQAEIASARLAAGLERIGEVLLPLRTSFVDFFADVADGFAILFGASQGDIGVEQLRRASADFREELKRNTDQFVAEQRKTISEQTDEQTKSIQEVSSKLIDEYDRLAAELKERQADILETVARTAEDFVDDISDLIKEAEDRISGLQDTISDLRQGAAEAIEQAADLQFQRTLDGLTEAQRVQALLNKLVEEEARLRQRAREFDGSDEALEELEAQQERVEDAAREAAREAERTDNQALIDAAQKAQIESLQEIARIRTDLANETAQTVSELDNQRLGNLKDGLLELQGIAEEIKVLDDLDGEAFTELRDRFQEALSEINIEDANAFGITDALRASIRDFGTDINEARFEWTNAVSSLKEAISLETYTADVDLRVDNAALDAAIQEAIATENPGRALRNVVEAVEAFRQGQAEAQAALTQTNTEVEGFTRGYNAAMQEAKEATGTLAGVIDLALDNLGVGEGNVIETAGNIAQRLENVREIILNSQGQEAEVVSDRLEQANQTIETLRNSGELTNEQANALRAAAQQLEELQRSIAEQTRVEGLIDEEAGRRATEILEGLEDNAREAKTNLDNASQALSNGATQAGNLNEGMRQSAEQAQAVNNSVDLLDDKIQIAINFANDLTEAFNRAAEAAASIPTPAGPAAAYFGGKIQHRAAGGSIGRGRDTIPALLSPGEFVINARAARNFTAQLQAINAGSEPVFREQGGSVTNVGDTNVTVTVNSNDGTRVGREIVQVVRREQRRQTSVL